MSGNRHRLQIQQMLEAAELAVSYVDGMDQAMFLADRKTQHAVVLNLLILGECATRMSPPPIRPSRGQR